MPAQNSPSDRSAVKGGIKGAYRGDEEEQRQEVGGDLGNTSDEVDLENRSAVKDGRIEQKAKRW